MTAKSKRSNHSKEFRSNTGKDCLDGSQDSGSAFPGISNRSFISGRLGFRARSPMRPFSRILISVLKRPLVAGLAILFVTICQCSTRSSSFGPVGRHPQLSEQNDVTLDLTLRSDAMPSRQFRGWRVRVLAYDRSELVAASILGPFFDAEKNPAGLRPLFMSDGYFLHSARHSITLPSAGSSMYIRFFENRIQKGETTAEDDEFLALHIQMRTARDLESTVCEASFWYIHNPVRKIVHCYLEADRQKKLELRLDRKDGQPSVTLDGISLMKLE